MRYLDVCAGISASTVAWKPLGWTAAAYSEIEAAPRAILAHHYPDVPLHGDFTTIRGDEYGPIDLLVGGTPCQDFSVAGLRAGLDGERGNLTLEYLRLADRARPRWLVWENVPGVLSIDGGRTFGAVLGGLAQLGYGFAYRVLDARYFGVPQRRRRVFVVGYLGDWRRAAAVLFERHSLSGHPAPRREAGQGAAAGPAFGISSDCFDRSGEGAGRTAGERSGLGITPDASPALRAKRPNAVAYGGNRCSGPVDVAAALQAHAGPAGRMDFATETFIAFDTTQITSAANYSNPKPGDPCHPLAAGMHPPAIAFDLRNGTAAGSATQQDAESGMLVTHALRGEGFDASEDGSGRGTPLVPVAFNSREDCSHGLIAGALGCSSPQAQAVAFTVSQNSHGFSWEGEVAATLQAKAQSPTSNTFDGIRVESAVRRLTPRECERLQGFPDRYTLVPYRKGMMADGSRYKALGNSMAVPVMRWIGERIAKVEAIVSPVRLAA